MEADCILEVLEELQVVVDYTPLGWPIMNPDYILREPGERLFIENRWVEHLDPFSTGSQGDQQVFEEFSDRYASVDALQRCGSTPCVYAAVGI